MFIQDIKKQNKSLEDVYEGLEFIQDACRDHGVTEGMKERVPVEQHFGLAQSLANVEEKCQKQANIITQKKQVPQAYATAPTGTGRYLAAVMTSP